MFAQQCLLVSPLRGTTVTVDVVTWNSVDPKCTHGKPVPEWAVSIQSQTVVLVVVAQTNADR